MDLTKLSFTRASAQALLNQLFGSVDAQPARRDNSREDGAAALHADGVDLGCFVKGQQSEMKWQ